MLLKNQPGKCGEDVIRVVHDCFMRVIIEYINAIGFDAIIQQFDREFIRCSRVFYLVFCFSPFAQLSNPCFFMAAIYHWLIQQHPNADQHRQVTDPDIIARIHATVTLTDESVLRYFMEAYNSVHGRTIPNF